MVVRTGYFESFRHVINRSHRCIFLTGIEPDECQDKPASDAVFLHCPNRIIRTGRAKTASHHAFEQRSADGLIKVNKPDINASRYLIFGLTHNIECDSQPEKHDAEQQGEFYMPR